MSTSNKNSKRFTYKNAGVNINEGNKLVNKIKNIVKQTERPGSIGNIGGFGGLFDLKKAGYNPVSALYLVELSKLNPISQIPFKSAIVFFFHSFL